MGVWMYFYVSISLSLSLFLSLSLSLSIYIYIVDRHMSVISLGKYMLRVSAPVPESAPIKSSHTGTRCAPCCLSIKWFQPCRRCKRHQQKSLRTSYNDLTLHLLVFCVCIVYAYSHFVCMCHFYCVCAFYHVLRLSGTVFNLKLWRMQIQSLTVILNAGHAMACVLGSSHWRMMWGSVTQPGSNTI